LKIRRSRGLAAQSQGVVGGELPLLTAGTPAITAPKNQRTEARIDRARKESLLRQFPLALVAMAPRF